MDNVNIESGEPNKSVREALMNYAAKMMNGLVQHDRFGPFLIPLNPNTNLKGAVHLNTPPPWCNENDIRTLISDLTPLEKQSLESFRKISRSDNKKFHLMIFASDAIVCKIIVLIRALHFCWTYYDPDTPQIQTVEAKPSELFNAHITPDIKLVFDAIVQFVLPCPIDLAGNKAIRLDNINKAMYLLLDFLAGWIPGKEVDDLRSTYAELIDRCSPALYEKILRCLAAVSTRFASEEPKWELERNKPKETSQPATEPKGKTSKKCHYIISQEKAAEDLGVTRQTIIRWEKEQTEDGPNNTSNQFGYYRGLRNLPGPYDLFVKTFNAYNRTDQKKSFVEFIEEFHRHNIKM